MLPDPTVRGVLALSTMHPGITKCTWPDLIHTRWLLVEPSECTGGDGMHDVCGKG